MKLKWERERAINYSCLYAKKFFIGFVHRFHLFRLFDEKKKKYKIKQAIEAKRKTNIKRTYWNGSVFVSVDPHSQFFFFSISSLMTKRKRQHDDIIRCDINANRQSVENIAIIRFVRLLFNVFSTQQRRRKIKKKSEKSKSECNKYAEKKQKC